MSVEINEEITVMHFDRPSKAFVIKLLPDGMFGYKVQRFEVRGANDERVGAKKISSEGTMWARGWGDEIGLALRAAYNLSSGAPDPENDATDYSDKRLLINNPYILGTK